MPSVKSLPENFGVFPENDKSFLGGDLRIGIEKDILNPSHITIWSNSLAAIAKRVQRTSFVFLRLGEIEKPESFIFQSGNEFHWNTMIDQLEEAKLLTGLNYQGLCFRVSQVYHWNSCENTGRLACFDQRAMV